jgi:hypothetical protein
MMRRLERRAREQAPLAKVLRAPTGAARQDAQFARQGLS